jgi:hypothetical protein
VVCVLLVLGLVIGVVASLGRAGPSPTTTSTRATTATLAPTTTSTPTTTTTDPGALPQTGAEPPSGDGALTARLSPLFSAIGDDDLAQAQTVFFPETAYISMKTGEIPDPSSDYQERLVAFLDLDLSAYNKALGSRPASAAYLGVLGDPSLATWIPPGTCENAIGYWHLPNVRLVYRTDGETDSFAVASLISWRGVWYVVHLGPNPRPVNVGTVALPATGPGTPGPGGGC